jgi:hypothetical protein
MFHKPPWGVGAILNGQLTELVRGVLLESKDARNTFDAMLRRGLSPDQAEAEIGMALLGCIWRQSIGHANLWTTTLQAMREGHAARELFPDVLDADGSAKQS